VRRHDHPLLPERMPPLFPHPLNRSRRRTRDEGRGTRNVSAGRQPRRRGRPRALPLPAG
jgi:hypothetical protein